MRTATLTATATFALVAIATATPVGSGAVAQVRALVTGNDIRSKSIARRHLRNDAVTGAAVRNRSLTGADVRDGSLRARDFRAGDLPRGETGPAGPAGSTGPAGPPGADGIVSSAYASGAGLNAASTVGRFGVHVTVDVPAGAGVYVNATKVVGSIAAGGGVGLSVWVCHRLAGADGYTLVGDGLANLRVPQNTRLPITLAADITAIPAGSYEVGLCSVSSSFTSWNDNDKGSVTALVHRV